MALSTSDPFSTLRYDGEKDMFSAWKDRIIAHLQALSADQAMDQAMLALPVSSVTHDSWLTQASTPPPLPPLNTGATLEEENEHKWQEFFRKTQQAYVRDLLLECVPKDFRAGREAVLKHMPLPRIWEHLYVEYGRTPVEYAVDLFSDLMRAAQGDFPNIKLHVTRLKAKTEELNRFALTHIKKEVVSEVYMCTMVLTLLPRQLSMDDSMITKEVLTFDALGNKLYEQLGNRSKAQIFAMYPKVAADKPVQPTVSSASKKKKKKKRKL